MEKIKVFISSTQTDLQPEREAVEKIVVVLGHECLRAETHTAPAKSPKQACRGMARDCDIYIGIYGKRYGFTDTELGVSVTEMEYDEARMSNPNKILVYIKREKEYEPRQQEFLKKVQDFHQGYFRHEFFSKSRVLRQQVRNDLVAWIAERIRKFKRMELDIKVLRTKIEFLQNYYKQVAEIQNLPKEILL